MNIGIYGGTFDPPHRGHIAAAKAAVSALHLDRLLLIPDAVPPHKVPPTHWRSCAGSIRRTSCTC